MIETSVQIMLRPSVDEASNQLHKKVNKTILKSVDSVVWVCVWREVTLPTYESLGG